MVGVPLARRQLTKCLTNQVGSLVLYATLFSLGELREGLKLRSWNAEDERSLGLTLTVLHTVSFEVVSEGVEKAAALRTATAYPSGVRRPQERENGRVRHDRSLSE